MPNDQECIETYCKGACCGMRFKRTFWGKYIVQVKNYYQKWDTNSGQDVGPLFYKWENATALDIAKLKTKTPDLEWSE